MAENLAFFQRAGLWHIVSQNTAAKSGCLDAAPRRKRLGYTGIPLSDELKSAVVALDGTDQCVALHCRGHQMLDLEDPDKPDRPGRVRRVDRELGARAVRLPARELSRRFGLAYSVVTPFSLAGRNDVIQIFDTGVLDRYFPPHTMMTNLGHPNWGVEFDPDSLIVAIPSARVADITRPKRGVPPVVHVLGILTGNSPESGIMLWEEINDRVRERKVAGARGDVAFPRVVIESVPEMGLSMELEDRLDVVREVVREGVRRLCERGATVVGIACNTTQYFAEDAKEICAEFRAMFISLVDATKAYLKDQHITQFSLLAIGPASGRDLSDFARLDEDFEIFRPAARGSKRIFELAFDIKADAKSQTTISKYFDVVDAVAKPDVPVLLALTELSFVNADLRKRRFDMPYHDTLAILADAMADVYIDGRLALGPRRRSPDRTSRGDRSA